MLSKHLHMAFRMVINHASVMLTDFDAISSSDSAHYAHTDLLHITTELWEMLVFSPANGAII